MIFTLRDLIAPLTEAEFITHLRCRKVLFLPNTRPDGFEKLINSDELNYLLESGLYPPERLRICSGSMSIPTNFCLDQGHLDPTALQHLLDQGASVIFYHLDKYLPRLWQLCQQIADTTGEQVRAEAIATTGNTGAVLQNCNKEDICMLQIAGSKRWRLYGANVVNPRNSIQSQKGEQNTQLLDEELSAGDLLFLPSGYGHTCENGLGWSLHVNILFKPPCGLDFVASIINGLACDETFNQPLTRWADASALAAHETALKACLIEQVRALSFADLLAQRAADRSKAVRIRIQGADGGKMMGP
jgi:ribosomal protein L16 Arg81 hydroxylase